jgi:hypothetical protein
MKKEERKEKERKKNGEDHDRPRSLDYGVMDGD